VIRSIDAEDSTTEADYSWVHFSIEVVEELQDKDIYVYGNFNNYLLLDENKMIFNPKTYTYETQILLKQGFYNYNYVTLDENDEMSTTEINGSFDETENEYILLVYYSKFGSNYDRVIGLGRASSRKMGQ
jgi:hypothetical protein